VVVEEVAGAVVVTEAAKVEWFSLGLLHSGVGDVFSVDGDVITIAAANGTWRYRIVETGCFAACAELVEGGAIPA
jgi:hypothetical protein